MNFSSSIIKNVVEAISNFPGIGQKTALRLVIYLLRNKKNAYKISNTIKELVDKINYCSICFNITEFKYCEICQDPKRDKHTICIVEDISDIMAIENTMQYKGQYHVLGGLISPIDGIGPSNLNIEPLINKLSNGNIKEVIFALCASMEGETTNYYIFKKIKHIGCEITTISKGISIGSELEYADQITLGRALINRYSFENTLKE
ncbi:MAG: recombination protein RecR [Flavobacteriales bacterium]|nr:recombination protein RecR [Flavobacteriales bacterium]|tara:strand:+ start:31020 stop:31634 length:615 start_codon:yes stop_codon:yes gene_type:complete